MWDLPPEEGIIPLVPGPPLVVVSKMTAFKSMPFLASVNNTIKLSNHDVKIVDDTANRRKH